MASVYVILSVYTRVLEESLYIYLFVFDASLVLV